MNSNGEVVKIKKMNSKFSAAMHEIAKHKTLYFMLAPMIVGYLLFHYLPMAGVVIAFKELRISKGIFMSPWVGLKYFQQVFRDEYFFRSVWNTLIISGYKLIFSFPVPIILALLLNEILGTRFKKIIQTIIYLPRFISWSIIAGLMVSLLSANGGVVNAILGIFNIEPINFMANEHYFRGLIIVSAIWKEAGWGTIIYTASLSGINPELYEAAVIDGANKFKQTIYISLPGLLPIIAVMLVLTISTVFNGNFEQIFTMYNPAVYGTGDIIDTFTYRKGLVEANYSYAAALGLSRSIISFILILSADKVSKKLVGQGII